MIFFKLLFMLIFDIFVLFLIFVDKIVVINKYNKVDIGYFCLIFFVILYVLDNYLLFFILNLGFLYNIFIYLRN